MASQVCASAAESCRCTYARGAPYSSESHGLRSIQLLVPFGTAAVRSPEWHPFHIHVKPFQVVEINGEPVDRKGYDDTIAIPAGGRVRIRTRYTDFDGQFVLHCHILFHEDHGMMQVVRIVDPARPDASLRNSEFDEPHRHHITPKPNSKRGRRPETN